jgi:uncharacterized membrane protein YdfJ with MMPL/SSD domain
MLKLITSWSFRHRRVVVLAWIALLGAITVAGMSFGGENKQDFHSPGTDSKAAVELLDERFPARAGDTVTIVIHDDAGVMSPRVLAVAEPFVDQVSRLPHVVGVTAPWDRNGSRQLSGDGTTGYATVQLDTTSARFPVDVATEMIDLAAKARAAGTQVELAGSAIDNAQSGSIGAEGPGLLVAAIVLLIAFGSLVAMGLPLATALFGVGVGLAGGMLLANVVDVPDWASSVATMLGVPVFGLRLGYPDAGNDPTSLTTSRAYDVMTEGFGAGFNSTFVLVADRGDTAAMSALAALDRTLAATPGVAAVSLAIASPNADAAVITLTPQSSPQDQATTDLLFRLRDSVVPKALADTDVTVRIGGITAANADQTESIAGRLPLFLAAVIGLAFLLLLAVFRSVLVAVKAAVLNLLSIVAAYGVIAYAAQGGWFGHLFGITTPTPIPAFIPMIMFAVLFGLSMDYEVFLLSRVREEYLRTRDNTTAVADGLAGTAKVITAAALIMSAVFGAFIFDDQIFLKIIGIGLAAAVIIDATIIRLVLVPATMQLLGDKNWWMPRWLDRIIPRLDIEGTSSPVLEPAADDSEPALVPA